MNEIAFTDAPAAQVDEIPTRLPVLPLKETVVVPDSTTPLAIGQERSIRLVDDVVDGEHMLALVTARDAEVEVPGWGDLYEIGTAAIVHKLVRVPDGTVRILVEGLRRIRLEEPLADDPYLVAHVACVPDETGETREVEALARNARGLYGRIIGLAPYLPEDLQIAAVNADDPSALCNLVASTLRLKTEEKQRILELADTGERLREVSKILNRELDVFELGTKIQSQVQSQLEQGQREFFLRQQLKAIQEELGEGDPERADANELRARLEALDLPDDARKAADRELARLERLPAAAAEYGVIRTYLDWLATLPWGVTTPDDLDLDRARQILDEDHYDLDQVKERIVEHLAVSKLRQDPAGQILCFVGPPGVGKTSLGQSIARTLGRRFARLSVGGVRDEAEIRGHRRTYVGAMPGSIVRALRDAESMNPVLLVDEIEKMGADVRGDPASAMLEVLDAAQNSTFRDHYLDLPLDLSKTLFVCTANTVDSVPAALLDRMDVIRLSGYTEEEKLGIARRHLVPRQVAEHGLEPGRIAIGKSALRLLIREYTREAGVRGLERRIGDLCRKAALQVARGAEGRVHVTGALAREWLGPRRFSAETRRRTTDPGLATALAYTPAGGDILYIEAQSYPGRGKLTVTGQLGEVMQESAQAALSWVRSHTGKLELEERWFSRHDVHLHVPAGAVPKDGPSAGIAMATAIASLVRERPVADDVALTGEITLTGRVLPIGGVRDKVLAAQRAGLGRVILPRENEHDLDELPAETRDTLQFVLVDSIDQVFDAAFSSNGPRATGRGRPKAARR